MTQSRASRASNNTPFLSTRILVRVPANLLGNTGRRRRGIGRRAAERATYLAIIAAVYFFLRAGSVLVAAVPALAGSEQAIPMLRFAAIFRQPNVFVAFVIYFGLFALSYLASSWVEQRRGLGGILGGLLFLLAAGDAAGLLLSP